MKSPAISEMTSQPPLYVRSITISILAMFCFVVLLGFSVFIDLRPAKALGIPDMPRWLKWALEKAWDFIKGVAKAFLLKFVQNMIVSLLQKLESIHVIRNFLDYSDALAFDKYVGSSLNKWIVQPLSKDEADQQPTDLNTIGAQALKTAQLTGPQMEALAYLNGGKKATAQIVFSAAKQIATAGEPVALNWVISGQGLGSAYLCQDKVNLAGAQMVRPSQTTIYVLQVRDAKNQVVDKKTVRIAVEGTKEKTCATAGGGILPGLSATQEKEMLRGAVALLTPQLACGGVKSSQVIRNVAIYEAAKVRGFNPRRLDPASPGFYQQMANYGNPFASEAFQELRLHDIAQGIEAQAQGAINQELMSNGMKALRAERNNITRTSQTVSDQIQQGVNAMFRNLGISADVSFASSVGSFLANTVTAFIFKEKGTVLTENPLCGLGLLATQGVYAGGIDQGELSQFGAASITVNGKSAINWQIGDPPVVLEWKVDQNEETEDAVVKITNIPAICGSEAGVPFNGKCEFFPTEDLALELQLVKESSTYTLGAASVTLDTGQSGGGATITSASFTADRTNITAGQTANLNWEVSGDNLEITLDGQSVTPVGAMTVSPLQTTTYVLGIFDSVSKTKLQELKVTIQVSGSVGGASLQDYLSPAFKVRE